MSEVELLTPEPIGLGTKFRARMANAGSTLLSWDWQVHPKGWYRPMSPLVGLLGHRMERKIWTGLKHKLEAEPSPPTS
jgi:hypothetical protein